MRRRVVFGLAAAGITAAFLLLGGVFSTPRAPDPVEEAIAAARTNAQRQDALSRLLVGLSSGDTAGYVRKLERRVRLDPENADALTLLGLSYQQRGRETGDPSFYSLSARALRRAARAGGQMSVIVQGEASLANTRHRFRAGLRLARAAIRLDPDNGSALGALGDALLNLGRYPAAFRAYDRMTLLTPGIASYTRVAAARELLGRPGAAARADAAALQIDTTVPENVAWTMTQLGNTAFNQGRLAAAGKAYRAALDRYPGYVHAEAGLARVEASEGRYRPAVARLRRAVDVLPIPAYVIMLGDILRLEGRAAEARQEYALVAAIERLFAANGVRTELQTAVFDLDHGRNVQSALRRARIAYASAPGIYADDALAWGLYRTGRCEAARAHSIRALRLGTRDALLMFHRAMIERCLGNPSATRWFRKALATNPHFSFLWVPVARRMLAHS
ncbi:MAG TPA: tetratricopeptide repeat protein [Gaiellaceae bacterium]|nr:tetratricopeptide repeat protein [Gaiellaceae bacterium]